MSDPDGGTKEREFGRIWRLCIGLFFITYLFTCKGYLEVSDTSFSVQTAEAIVTRGSLEIPPTKGSTLKGPDGRNFSKYGIGLALYYVPWVATAHQLSSATRLPAAELTGFLLSFANLPFALLALHLFARCLRMLGITVKTTVVIGVALGFGTLFWRYAGYDFSEMMQASLLLLCLYGVLRRSRGGAALGGMGFAGLILVKLVHLAFLPAFLGYLLARPGKPLGQRIREAVHFLWPVVAALGFVACLNAVRFGNPLESGYGDEAGKFFPTQLWWTVPKLLVSFDKGIFLYCPVLFLGLLGWRRFWQKYPWEAALCGALIVANLLLAGAWHSWVGGWSWGARLLVPTLPLWLLPAAFWLDDRSGPRKLIGTLILTGVSMVTQIPGVLIKDQQFHHMKQTMLTIEEQPEAYSDYIIVWHLLYHKVFDSSRGEVYKVSEIGVPGNRELDVNAYRTFQGINLWTEHIARQFKRPVIRWLPLAGAVIVGFLAVRMWRLLSLQDHLKSQISSQP